MSHALLGNRRVLPSSAIHFLDQFRAPRSTAEAASAASLAAPSGVAEGEWRDRLAAFVRELLEAGLLVADDVDEDSSLRESMRLRWVQDGDRMILLGALADGYEPTLVSAAPAAPVPAGGEVSFLLLGWCFTQSVRPVLVAEAARRRPGPGATPR